MKQALIDTDILSMFFRGNENIENHFQGYLQEYGEVNISILTYYEIVSGLKHKDAKKQMDSFLEFVSNNLIYNLTEKSTQISATLFADLRKKGTPVDDIDLLIAGIALEHDFIVVTNNTSHFERIKGLEVENWSQK
ncbi:MAG: tRNA(fMet)-specific endonuclease VapC [Chloroflexi bacterium]|nr:tRNA(fMet)-specific endonuclease VapC [Chloroflexota bacterium]